MFFPPKAVLKHQPKGHFPLKCNIRNRKCPWLQRWAGPQGCRVLPLGGMSALTRVPVSRGKSAKWSTQGLGGGDRAQASFHLWGAVVHIIADPSTITLDVFSFYPPLL